MNDSMGMEMCMDKCLNLAMVLISVQDGAINSMFMCLRA